MKIAVLSALVVTLSFTGIAEAHQLSPTQQLESARSLCLGDVSQKLACSSLCQPIYTSVYKGKNLFYVYPLEDQGFVILGADDVAAPVLGYCESGVFDSSVMPSNISSWLDGYSREIAAAIENGNAGSWVSAAEGSEYADIEPLCLTKWGQNEPYNFQCPQISGIASPAGCCATALAQIMKHWNYPQHGLGRYEYEYTLYDGTRVSQSLDFRTVNFDWDNMCDSYTGSYDENQSTAVATLMYTVGVAINTIYDIGGSSSTTVKSGMGLLRNLAYDKGAMYVLRHYYTGKQWHDLLYGELSAGRPVFYSGDSEVGGHAFVCDGYRAGGYFHFNWGWDGMCDGYFLLSALSPLGDSLIDSDDTYMMNNCAIVGIQPHYPTSSRRPSVGISGGFDVAETSCQIDGASNVKFCVDPSNQCYWNYSLYDIDCRLGVKAENIESGEVTYIASLTRNSSLEPLSGFYSMIVPSTSFSAGNYRLSPAFYCNEVWRDVLVPVGRNASILAEVTDNTITFSREMGADEPVLSVADLQVSPHLYLGKKCLVTANVTALRNCCVNVAPVLKRGDSVLERGAAQSISLDEGESGAFSWLMELDDLTFTGAYKLQLVTSADDRVVSQSLDVEVEIAPEGTPDIKLVSATMPGCPGDGSPEHPFVFNPSDFKMNVSLKNEGAGVWTELLSIGLYEKNSGRLTGFHGAEYFSLGEGQMAEASFKDSLTACDGGTEYCVQFRSSGDTTVDGVVYCKASFDGSGLETVTLIEPSVEVWSIDGVKLVCPDNGAAPSLMPGIYVIRKTDCRNNTEVKKIIVK